MVGHNGALSENEALEVSLPLSENEALENSLVEFVKEESIKLMNQNEQILQQQQAIEKEIREKSNLVGDPEDLITVQEEFKEDPVYQAKVENLASKYSKIRRTRPDGNCFFRALAFAYFEKISNDIDSFERFHALVAPSKNIMIDAGLSDFGVGDLYDSFMEQLKKLRPSTDEPASEVNKSNGVLSSLEKTPTTNRNQHGKLDDLMITFNDQGVSDCIVAFLRLLTSVNLKNDAEFYKPFMEGDMDVATFCSLEVEPMNKESDHIHVIAITKQTGIKVRVQYLDRGTNSEAKAHDFPDAQGEDNPDVHLLYKPGHYDILYPKN